MILNDISDASKNTFYTIRAYVKSSFLLSLVVLEIFSGTKLFESLKTAVIFGGSFLFFTAISILIGSAPAVQPNIGLTIHQFCSKYGYHLQNQTVTTEDGYILTMHRIACPHNKTNCKGKRPPVLLMHGLLGSSADYIAQGPNKSLALQLVDKGYDVWLGNQRGNTWSRAHIMLDPNEDSSFWDFSFHEIGIYDIPRMIDHIIEVTDYSKLSYIGMSQGCIAYLAMASSKPEYNAKVNLASVVAPVTTLYKTRNIVFRSLNNLNFIFNPLTQILNVQEVMAEDWLYSKILRYICLGPHKIANWICTEYFLKYLIGASDQMDYDLLPFHLSLNPSGASMKQFRHIIQGAASGNFSEFDYFNDNEYVYNQPIPPKYNLTKITAPLAVYYSRGDYFTNAEVNALPLYKTVWVLSVIGTDSPTSQNTSVYRALCRKHFNSHIELIDTDFCIYTVGQIKVAPFPQDVINNFIGQWSMKVQDDVDNKKGRSRKMFL